MTDKCRLDEDAALSCCACCGVPFPEGSYDFNLLWRYDEGYLPCHLCVVCWNLWHAAGGAREGDWGVKEWVYRRWGAWKTSAKKT